MFKIFNDLGICCECKLEHLVWNSATFSPLNIWSQVSTWQFGIGPSKMVLSAQTGCCSPGSGVAWGGCTGAVATMQNYVWRESMRPQPEQKVACWGCQRGSQPASRLAPSERTFGSCTTRARQPSLLGYTFQQPQALPTPYGHAGHRLPLAEQLGGERHWGSVHAAARPHQREWCFVQERFLHTGANFSVQRLSTHRRRFPPLMAMAVRDACSLLTAAVVFAELLVLDLWTFDCPTVLRSALEAYLWASPPSQVTKKYGLLSSSMHPSSVKQHPHF